MNFTTEFLTNNKILLRVWETWGEHYDAHDRLIHNAVTTHQSLIKVFRLATWLVRIKCVYELSIFWVSETQNWISTIR